MYVLYEDSGTFKAEKIFASNDSTLQVEAESGKRSKIKKNTVLFEFAQPAPAELLALARSLADTLEIEFLWECAPQEEFDAAAFAEDYFGHPPSAVEKAALIFALNAAPVYFHRRGKGKYRPAPPDILQAALAAVEKKQRLAAQQQEWTDTMIAGELPAELADQVGSFLSKPDKNSMGWKAFDAAVTTLGITPEKLLLKLGALPHPLALHQHRFLSTHFPKGTHFAPIDTPPVGGDLPVADVEAYSVDDSSTFEVDDALSVTEIEPGIVRIGVHIAAPGLAVTRDSHLDKLARERMSTVYAPGQKIPMLPMEVIEAFSLDEGKLRPALSLYVTANLETGELLSSETRLERLRVQKNLRHDVLDADITVEGINDPHAALPYGHWLRPLWRQAMHLVAQREQVRGKPEMPGRIDYSFVLDGPADDPNTPVRLLTRQRDAPLDRLVAEYMILANSQWGGLLAESGLPGIYRSQQAGRVRMSTHAMPHEAIGVPQYAWSTSPLRRYVDLTNQRQLIAAAEHGISARLVAPYKPKDADLFAIIGAFESQYTSWADYQSSMERYWCLRWLKQQGHNQVTASVLRDDLVRLDCAPLVTRVPGLPPLERGHKVTLDILDTDELSLELICRLREVASA